MNSSQTFTRVTLGEPEAPLDLVYLLDGTWQSNDDGGQPRTNIQRAFDELTKAKPKRRGQLIAHVDGAGQIFKGNSVPFIGAFLALGNYIGGGAFGTDLPLTLRLLYQDVAKNYRYGGRIYLIGYSRGAYLARALAGMLRNCGILDKSSFTGSTRDKAKEALELYQDKEIGPNPDKALEFRFKNSLPFQTNKYEYSFRTRQKGQRKEDVERLPKFKIDYVGSFDCVGQFGIPKGALKSDRNPAWRRMSYGPIFQQPCGTI